MTSRARSDSVGPCGGLSGAGHRRRAERSISAIDGRTFIGIASCGFDSEANRIANQTTVVRGNLVYAYGALRALVGWSPATFTVKLDGGDPRVFVGYSVAAANAKAFGGGIFLAPTRRCRTAAWTW